MLEFAVTILFESGSLSVPGGPSPRPNRGRTPHTVFKAKAVSAIRSIYTVAYLTMNDLCVLRFL